MAELRLVVAGLAVVAVSGADVSAASLPVPVPVRKSEALEAKSPGGSVEKIFRSGQVTSSASTIVDGSSIYIPRIRPVRPVTPPKPPALRRWLSQF